MICRYCYKDFTDPIDNKYIYDNGMCLRCEELMEESNLEKHFKFEEDEEEEYETINDDK